MKTSHIVIICVTVFLLVALHLSYKAMVLTSEKDEREGIREHAMGVILNPDYSSYTEEQWESEYKKWLKNHNCGINPSACDHSLENFKLMKLGY